MITVNCFICRKDVKRWPYQLKHRAFCSKECRAIFVSKQMSGNTFRAGHIPYNKGATGVSDETREKMRAKKLGRTTWNKGVSQTDNAKVKNRLAHKGKRASVSTEFKKGQKPHNYGVPNPLLGGANNPLWKGGITIINHGKRAFDSSTIEYKEWRREVFSRDGFVCWFCGEHRHDLQAHHIKRWIDDEQLRHEVSNGVTLCRKCHISVNNHENEWASWFNFVIDNELPNRRYR